MSTEDIVTAIGGARRWTAYGGGATDTPFPGTDTSLLRGGVLPKAVYMLAAGDLHVSDSSAQSSVIAGLPVGAMLPIRPAQLLASQSTRVLILW